MFGLLKEIVGDVAAAAGTVLGVAVAPIAAALDVSESAVRRAIEAGCRTERDVREWLLIQGRRT
jgi:hypothetical protein